MRIKVAPVVFSAVSSRTARRHTVEAGLLDDSWIQNVTGPLNSQGLVEFLHLVDSLAPVTLTPGQADVLRWTWSSYGVYSMKSVFLHFFEGRPTSPTWSQI